MKELAKRIGQILEKAQNDQSAATVEQIAVAKEMAERFISQAGDTLRRHTEESFELATDRLL